MHCNWRDCQEWKKQGLQLSTTNNEAAKLYDALLTQYVGWYDEQTLGGMEGTAKTILSTDPQFVMGRVLVNGLEIMGTGRSPRLDPTFRKELDEMSNLAKSSNLTKRELQHVEAIRLCGEGRMLEGALVWEDILIDYPTDILALKLAHDSYFYRGELRSMRDSIARVLPAYKETVPLYGYLPGMYAFGLNETDHFAEAEKYARKGLDLIPKDAWATHALAHVFEMQGRTREGISFLSQTLNDWTFCGMLACHNFWHWAVYHIEQGEHSAALDIYDAEVGQRVKSGAMLDVVDACSLLYRLELEGVEVGEDRWEAVYEICRPHVDDHLLVFNDMHFLMSYLGAKKRDCADRLLQSMKEFTMSGEGSQQPVMKKVGTSLAEAFIEYDSGNFEKAVDIIKPLRYDVLKIGGSNAQRDLFFQFAIHAALKSKSPQHQKLARSLLIERKAYKPDSPMTDRLMARSLAQHE